MPRLLPLLLRCFVDRTLADTIAGDLVMPVVLRRERIEWVGPTGEMKVPDGAGPLLQEWGTRATSPGSPGMDLGVVIERARDSRPQGPPRIP